MFHLEAFIANYTVLKTSNKNIAKMKHIFYSVKNFGFFNDIF